MTTNPRRKRRLVTRTDFARLARVSQAAITKASRKQIANALVGKNGERIDLDHPEAAAYLAAHGVTDVAPTETPNSNPKRASAPTAASRKGGKGVAGPTPARPSPPPPDPLRTRLDELEVLNQEERWRERQLKNDEASGRLISREFVRAHVFGAITNLHKRLLEDVPRTLASRLLSAARSGVTLEQSEAIVVDVMSGHLEALRAIAVETLNDPD